MITESQNAPAKRLERDLLLLDTELLRHRARILSCVGVGVYSLFVLLDLAVAPDQLVTLAAIRFGTAAILGLCAWRLRPGISPLRVQVLALIIVLSAAEGVVALTVLLGGFQSSYYIGVALVVFTSGLLLPMPSRLVWSYSFVVLASYVGSNAWVHGVNSTHEVLEPTLFLFTLSVLATLATYLERGRRRTELGLRQELERRLDERDRAARLANTLGEREARLARVGEISGTIIHDLRQPLTVLAIIADSLSEGGEADPPDVVGPREIETISRQIHRMRAMITEALDLCRGGELVLDLQTVSIGDLLEPLLADFEMIARGAGVALEVALGPGDEELGSTVEIDRGRLERVIHNLFRNALEACTASEKTDCSSRVRIEVEASNTTLTLRVMDGGDGLEPSEVEQIFEVLVTRNKAGGVGLGLGLARRVIEAHQGTLEVEGHSALGGASFSVSIPKIRVRKRERAG